MAQAHHQTFVTFIFFASDDVMRAYFLLVQDNLRFMSSHYSKISKILGGNKIVAVFHLPTSAVYYNGTFFSFNSMTLYTLFSKFTRLLCHRPLHSLHSLQSLEA